MTCHFLRLSRSLIENPTFQQILPTIILRYSRLPSRSRTGLVMLLDLFLVRFSLIFLSVPCDGLSWLHVSFYRTLNTQYRIDRIVTHSSHCGGAQTSPALRTQLVTDWLPSWHVMTIRGVARGGGAGGLGPPREQIQKNKRIWLWRCVHSQTFKYTKWSGSRGEGWGYDEPATVSDMPQ